jgi:integrase
MWVVYLRRGSRKTYILGLGKTCPDSKYGEDMNCPEFFQDAPNFSGIYAQQYRNFVLKRISLKNVTLKSVAWYQQSFAAFRPALESAASEKELRFALEDQIEVIAQRTNVYGNKITATTVNTYTRALQAFLGFLLQREVISKPIVLPKLKAAKKLKQPLTDDEIAKLCEYKPRNRHERLIHTAIPWATYRIFFIHY